MPAKEADEADDANDVVEWQNRLGRVRRTHEFKIKKDFPT